MITIDFSYLSHRNSEFKKHPVVVANGVTFLTLVITDAEKMHAANIIYLHVHRESRKCYVGITVQTAGARWHSGPSYGLNTRFGRALNKYGWDAFDSCILAFCEDRESLQAAEVTAIVAAGGHKTKFTYNLSPGGDIVAENDKPIVGVYLPTGEVTEFKSGSDAARIIGFSSMDTPMSVARGEFKSVKDWWFRFQEDESAQPPLSWGEVLRHQNLHDAKAKPLVAINFKTGETRHFLTQQLAAENLGVHQSVISSVLCGQGYSGNGWWFRFEDDDREMPKNFGFQAIREKRDIKVYATHLRTGEKRSFRNCTVADVELGIHQGAAASVARGERTSAADWWFSFDGSELPPREFKGALVAKARSKPVIAINLQTKHEQEFPSAKVAAAELGMSRAAISKVIKGELKAVKGFHFRFA